MEMRFFLLIKKGVTVCQNNIGFEAAKKIYVLEWGCLREIAPLLLLQFKHWKGNIYEDP